MTLAEVVSITGMPGLYKVVNKRADGLIVTSLVDDKTQFVSGRTHLFSTLDNITMYTDTDNADLKTILATIKKNEADLKPTAIKADADFKAFMEKVLPDYDKEKVYVSDIKKLVKWYLILDGKKLIEELTSDNAVVENADNKIEETADGKPKKEAKPKKEPKPKVEKSVKEHTKVAAPKKVTTPRKLLSLIIFL